VHTLAVLDPGHFHAALTLGARHPAVRDDLVVYAPKGPELDDFLALIDAFNRRGVEPTAWRVEVRAGDRSLERLVADRPGDLVVLAGRNDRKPATIRRLHDAGFHILADKPWMAGPDGLDDLRHALAAGPLVVEMMTGPHEITGKVATRLVADDAVFGGFVDDEAGGGPAIEITSVHHLEKTVNGRPLRRPPWYFDVRVQGDGIADIPTHIVDQAQRLVRAATPGASEGGLPLELLEARTWSTPVPRALFERITGLAEFPSAIASDVTGSELAYRSNAALAFRAGGVRVALDTRWEPSAPSGGGDHHRALLRGARSLIRIEQGPTTAFLRRLSIEPRGTAGAGAGRVQAALERALARWPDTPGLALAPTAAGWDLVVPAALDVGHERHFAAVLAEFLALVERGERPERRAADTLAKYTLLAQASARARGQSGGAPQDTRS
jgi:predicted dehydrogenase